MGKQANIKGVQEREKTEFTKIREQFNLTKSDVANELGVSLGSYTAKETEKRPITQKTRSKFYYDIWHACINITNRLKEKSEDVELNSYIKTQEFSTVEEEIEDECKLKLFYPKITQKDYEKMEREIIAGYTVIQVAVRGGFDEIELARMLEKNGVDYDYGDSLNLL